MPWYMKGKPGIQIPRKSEGGFALNSITMQLCLLQVSVPHTAATELQKLLTSLLFQNIDLSRYNTEG